MERVDTPPEGYKYTKDELILIVNNLLIKDCKLDACIDKYLMAAKRQVKPKKEDRYYYRHPPGFNEREKFQNLKQQLLDDIARYVPDYFPNPPDTSLSDENSKLRKRIASRWRYNWGGYNREPEAEDEDHFHKRMIHILSKHRLNQVSASAAGASEGPSSLQGSSFIEACRQLRTLVEGENSSASFACGGTISIGNIDTEQPSSSPPVNLFWAAKEDAQAQKLELPLTDTQQSNPSPLQRLVADCTPATFGRGDQDVLDPNYRMAGKLDPEKFASSFHPADFGILENVEQILLPSVRTDLENCLQHRKITAHLYKLNVYSGPSGLFRKHVDTPRSQNQIGSLVVCLPCEFKGGKLLVRHDGQEVCFDWASTSASNIQWAAFYSDCEHEIETVTEGHRITLTYNLYATEAVGLSLLPNPIIDPKSLPLYEYVRGIIENPGFLREGGVLGFFCSHTYPHTLEYAQEALPRSLKGSDLVLYSVFKSLGIDAKVLPAIDFSGAYAPNNPQLGISGRLPTKHPYIQPFFSGVYRAAQDLRNFRKAGYILKPGWSPDGQRVTERSELELEYEDIGTSLSDWDDIDKHWKTILLGRQVIGLSEEDNADPVIGGLPEEEEEEEEQSKVEMTGTRLGTRLHPYTVTDLGGEDMRLDEVASKWPFYYLPGITWLTEPKKEAMALCEITYGNQASIGSRYSCAAIVAIIPPWNERMGQSKNVESAPEPGPSGEGKKRSSKRRKKSAEK